MSSSSIGGGFQSKENFHSSEVKSKGSMGDTKVSSKPSNESSKETDEIGQSVLKQSPPPLPKKPILPPKKQENFQDTPKTIAQNESKKEPVAVDKQQKGHFEKTWGKGGGERETLVEGKSELSIRKKELSEKGELNFIDRHRFVKIKGEEGKVYAINIRSVAKRLGLSHTEVKEIAGSEGAEGKLKAMAEKRAQVLEKYEKLFSDYKTDFFGKYRGEGKQIGLTPKLVLKVIGKGLELPETGGIFQLQHKKSTLTFSASKDFSNLYVMQKTLGSGAFGVVYKSFDVLGKQLVAIKESIAPVKGDKTVEGHEKSLEEMQNERLIVNDLRKQMKGRSIKGLPQEIHSEITVFTHKIIQTETVMDEGIVKEKTKGEFQVQKGLLVTNLASGDLQSAAFMEKFGEMGEKRFALIDQLFEGMEFLHECGYAHGDTKLENMLVINDSKGNPESLFLHDLAGAKKDEYPATITPLCTPSDSGYARFEVGTGSEMDAEERHKSAQRSDVFGLALGTVEILIGQRLDGLLGNAYIENVGGHDFARPIEKDSESEKLIKKELGNMGVPESVARVLISGLHPQGQRPSMSELRRQYNEALLT